MLLSIVRVFVYFPSQEISFRTCCGFLVMYTIAMKMKNHNKDHAGVHKMLKKVISSKK